MTRLLFSLLLAAVASATVQFEFRKVPAPNRNQLERRASTVAASLANAETDLLYLINVTVGTPGQSLALQLDTGSSDIWVPGTSLPACRRGNRCADGVFDSSKSSSFQDIAQGQFQIQYVDGTQIQGDYFADTLKVGGATLENFTMGLATQQASQDDTGPFQGIAGVGFASDEAIAGQSGQTYPNFPQVLKSSGSIKTQAYSLWLNDVKASTGSILFGGVDTAKYHGDLTVLPVLPDAQSGGLTSFTVALDNFEVIGKGGQSQYSQKNLALPVVLDSGTTLTYLPDQIANDVITGVGAANSQEYGVVVPCSVANSPATINFGFGAANGATIAAPIGQFVLPFPAGTKSPHFRNNNAEACLWGLLPAGGQPNLLGDTFLRSAYVVYNLDGKQIGLAATNFNSSDSNVQEIAQTSSIPNAATTVAAADVTQTYNGTSFPTDANGLFTILNGGGSGGGGAASTISAGAATGTFNLGQPTSTSSSSSSSGGGKSDAHSSTQIPPSILVSFAALLMVLTAVARL